MIHDRQRLPFRFEPGDNTLGIHPQLDDLQRNATIKDRLLLLGHIDNAAPPFPNLLEQFIAPNAVPYFFPRNLPMGSRRPCRPRWPRRGRPFIEETARFVMNAKQVLDLPSQIRIPCASLIQERAALLGGQFQRSRKHRNLRVGRFVHDNPIIHP